MNTHLCIKCKVQYQDGEIDDYYCSPCNEERKRIAQEIDKKFSGKSVAPIKSALQEYEEAPKFHGFPRA